MGCVCFAACLFHNLRMTWPLRCGFARFPLVNAAEREYNIQNSAKVPDFPEIITKQVMNMSYTKIATIYADSDRLGGQEITKRLMRQTW